MAHQIRDAQALAYKFDVVAALPQVQEAPETFGRDDYISNQASQPIWPPPETDSAFYLSLGPSLPVPAHYGQYHMTPALTDAVSATNQAVSPVYNNPVLRPPYRTTSSSSFNPPTAHTQTYKSPMIAFAGTSNPVSPVSLNNDDKSSIVSPLARRSSDAGNPVRSGQRPTMPDLQSEQEPSYRLPRIHPPKREGEPPKNADGKLICSVDTRCGHLLFERKCEWR